MPDRSPKRGVSPVTQLKHYPTRLDRFRVASGIDFARWLDELGLTRNRFTPIRAGRDVTLETAALVVRAARKTLGRAVQPSELFDFGEDTPPGSPRALTDGRWRPSRGDRQDEYDTPLDRLLVREQLRPATVARQAGITRQSFLNIRTGRTAPRVSTVRKVVTALRQLTGKPVRASNLFDVGDGIEEEIP